MFRQILLWATLLISLTIARADGQTLPPSNPTPLDGATGVATVGPLNWSPVPGAQSYDLRLGTNPSDLSFAASLITAPAPTPIGFTPPALSSKTTYYWQVTARLPSGQVASPIWSFTTAGSVPRS